MSRVDELARIAELIARMDAEQLLIFRALILAEQGRPWRAVEGATISRLREWITIGQDE